MRGGILLRKMPLGVPVSVKSRIEIVVVAMDQYRLMRKHGGYRWDGMMGRFEEKWQKVLMFAPFRIALLLLIVSTVASAQPALATYDSATKVFRKQRSGWIESENRVVLCPTWNHVVFCI
jgi:hypothetical protein